MKIVLATHNLGKVKRYQDKLLLPNIDLISLKDLDLQVPEPEENGRDEMENAQIKAKYYFTQIQGKLNQTYLVLATDTGFYIDGLASENQPGKHVQGIAGVLPRDSDEVRFDKMTNFYIQIANQFHGQVQAYFKDTYCLYDGQNFMGSAAIRPVTLTNRVNKKDVHFPISSLYIANSANKHYQELNPEEMSKFLKPSLETLQDIFVKFDLIYRT